MSVLPLAKFGLILNRPAYIEEAKRQTYVRPDLAPSSRRFADPPSQVHIKVRSSESLLLWKNANAECFQYLVDNRTGLFFHGWEFPGTRVFSLDLRRVRLTTQTRTHKLCWRTLGSWKLLGHDVRARDHRPAPAAAWRGVPRVFGWEFVHSGELRCDESIDNSLIYSWQRSMRWRSTRTRRRGCGELSSTIQRAISRLLRRVRPPLLLPLSILPLPSPQFPLPRQLKLVES